MPDTKWNKSFWMEDIENFNKGNSKKDLPDETHYGDRWGNTETDNEGLKLFKNKFEQNKNSENDLIF